MIRATITEEHTLHLSDHQHVATRVVELETDAAYNPDAAQDLITRAVGAWMAQVKTLKGDK